jgi:hypothetical protein
MTGGCEVFVFVLGVIAFLAIMYVIYKWERDNGIRYGWLPASCYPKDLTSEDKT